MLKTVYTMYPCGACGDAVDESFAVGCEGFCDRWFHPECVNVTKDDYELINQLNDKVKWFCEKCTSRLDNLVKQVNDPSKFDQAHTFEPILNTLLTRIEQLELRDNMFEVMSMKLDAVNEAVALVQNTLLTRPSPEHRPISDSELLAVKEFPYLESVRHNSKPNSRPNGKHNGRQHRPSRKNQLPRSESNVQDLDASETDTPSLAPNLTILVTDNKDSKILSPESGRPGPEQLSLSSSSLKIDLQSKRSGLSDRLQDKEHENLKEESSQQQDAYPPQRKKDFVVGRNDSLKAVNLFGQPKAWVFVGKVKKGTSAEQLGEFLKDSLPGVEFKVESLNSKGSFESFKISTDMDQKDKIMDPSVWPKNAFVRRYFFSRRAKEVLR